MPPRIPTTFLERAAEKFWNASLDRAVSGATLFKQGTQQNPWLTKAWLPVLKGLALPSRSVFNRLADQGEEVALRAGARGEVQQSHTNWVVGQMREARQSMQRLDDHLQQRSMFLNQLDAELQYFSAKHGLKPTDDAWFAIRRDLEAGADTPQARDLGAIVDRSRDMMGRFWNEKEAALAARFNRLPVIIDPAQFVNRPIQFHAAMDELTESILRQPEMQSLARAALAKPEGAALVNSEVADYIRTLVVQEGRGTAFKKPHGLVRSPYKVLARRTVPLDKVPEHWRLHPYQELLEGLHDEFSFIADASTLGREGGHVQSTIRWLRGELSPEDIMNLSPEARKIADQRRHLVGLAPELTGDVQKGMADMLEQLARAYTGQYNEEAWAWALRNGVAPAGSISMMAFSALPNAAQALTEGIVRGFSGFSKAYGLGNKDKARMMGLLTGQKMAALGTTDFTHGTVVFNEKLARAGGTKGPGALFRGELPSIIDPRWYWNNFSILDKYGMRGMRAAAQEFLQANGFSGVEDWLRRGSIIMVQDEVPRLQAILRVNRNNGEAIRRMRSFGFDDVDQFLRVQLPTDPASVRRAFWGGDIDEALRLKDWQKVYHRGVGQTQFNYAPGDFPMIFSHPYFGTVGLQFRRFAYSQASKVVAHVVNEASAGNVKPLLYMAAAVPSGGELVRKIRNVVSQRELAFISPTEPVTGEEPIVGRAKEVRTPFGNISVNMRRQLENVAAIGLMGMYTDAWMTFSEDKPLLLASWGVGVFPTEAFNFASKLVGGLGEVAFGPEQTLGYGRVGGPKAQEAARQVVRSVPFVGRLVGPHVRWGRSRYQRLREFGMRAFLSRDFDTFNRIQTVMVEQFYSPITMDDMVNRMYRQALKEAGYAGTVPRPGDPGYIAYRALAEHEGRARKKRPVRGGEYERAAAKALEEQSEFFQKIPTEEGE